MVAPHGSVVLASSDLEPLGREVRHDPLQELELGEPAIPGVCQIADGRPGAEADHAIRRRWRQRRFLGGGADQLHRVRFGHPGQHVARSSTQIEDDGVARRGRLDPVVVDGDDGRDPLLPLEPGQPAR